MKIYHGSEFIIEEPAYGKGGHANDYGRGFYCTENVELAKEWACARNVDGYANGYELEMDGLKVLNLNGEGYHILHWLALLAEHRSYWQRGSVAEEAKRYLKEHFLLNIEGYDVIIGYRADDSYFSFAQDFVGNVISLRKLKEAMYLGKLGEQIVLKSHRAFEAIRFIGFEEARAEEYFYRKMERDREARRGYRRAKQTDTSVWDIFMLDIKREEMRDDDPRLR